MRGLQTLKGPFKPWHSKIHYTFWTSFHTGMELPQWLSDLLSGQASIITPILRLRKQIQGQGVIQPQSHDQSGVGLELETPSFDSLLRTLSTTPGFFFLPFPFLSGIHFLAISQNLSQLWPHSGTAHSKVLSSRLLAGSTNTCLSPNSSSIFCSKPSVPIKPPSFFPTLTPNNIPSRAPLGIYHQLWTRIWPFVWMSLRQVSSWFC